MTRPDVEEYDAERYESGTEVLGGPVDAQDERPTVFATILASHDAPRRPIVPAALRNPDQRKQGTKLAVAVAVHHTGYHLTRSPKYAAKVLLWSPVGVFRGGWRIIHWLWDLEGQGKRQAAASAGSITDYMTVSAQRDRRVGIRMRLLLPPAIALLVALVLFVELAPLLWHVIALLIVLPSLAVIGRPADKPITDRVTIGEAFVRLTAEQVRAALVSMGIRGIKDPADLRFPEPGIHKDGPGWLARVNLPAGVEVTDVLERRGRLSSALRLPVDQVWPSAGPDHAGQLDLWVGFQPSSKMGQPRWSLASDKARTSVFTEWEFGTDQRQRQVRTSLFARNFLIGGVPGSGKSYGARTLAMIAALDPTCELKIAEFKGTADFGDLAPLCSEYYCGVDDEALQGGAGIIAWGLAEAERRGKRIRAARERGEAPEGKVTPELAAKPGSGLHPVFILIDEAHELLCDKQAADAAERLIKRGRALGLIVVLATQIPDAKSVPPNITRCVTMRWCLAVQDYQANDMILGTGAYKRGLSAAVYRPGLDAGWGIITGLAEPTSVRSHFPDEAIQKAMVRRATQLRGGVVGSDEPVSTRDVLNDVRTVFRANEAFVSWQQIAARLAEHWPEFYAEITAGSIGVLARDLGAESGDGKDRGSSRTLKGLRLDGLTELLSQREIEASEGVWQR